MIDIKTMYRSSYVGEDITSTATYENGVWSYETDRITNSLSNDRSGKIAVVIGNGPSRRVWDRDYGGLNKIRRNPLLQIYGCNAGYRDFKYDYLVVTGTKVAAEIATTSYPDGTVCYANIESILNHPGKYHLVPQNPRWDAGSMAAYLAAFDQHAKVYLLGFDGIDTPNYNMNYYAGTNGYNPTGDSAASDVFWGKAMGQVFAKYPLVDFVCVNETGKGYMPLPYRVASNLRRVSYFGMVQECDLYR